MVCVCSTLYDFVLIYSQGKKEPFKKCLESTDRKEVTDREGNNTSPSLFSCLFLAVVACVFGSFVLLLFVCYLFPLSSFCCCWCCFTTCSGNRPLHVASALDNLEFLNQLLEAGCDIEVC